MNRTLTRRNLLVGASGLALIVLAAACGQPEPQGGLGAAPTDALPTDIAPIPRSTFTPPGPGTPGFVPATHPPMPPATQTAFARITPGRPGSPVPTQPTYLTPTPVPPRQPEDPIAVGRTGHPVVVPQISARASSIIARGRLDQIFPPEWSTPDGRRPADPLSPESLNNYYAIYTPLLVTGEEYLKGASADPRLLLYWWGGQIGQDIFAESPSLIDTLSVGQNVIVFARPGLTYWPSQRNGLPVLMLLDTYILRDDGVALNLGGTIPTADLVQKIRDAAGQ